MPIGGHDRTEDMARYLLGRYDVPAYVRRARRVEDALEDALRRCQCQRDEWLEMVRLRLGMLRAILGKWENLRPLLADDAQVEMLRALEAELRPELRAPVATTRSKRVWRAALADLVESLEHFNCRWREYLQQFDLTPLNKQRQDYNRYYLVEKECAVRSARLARHGYRPLQTMTNAELEAAIPPLPVPRVGS